MGVNEPRARITIESQGTGLDTSVLTHPSGEIIEGISDATIRIAAGDVNRVDLSILMPKIEVMAEVDTVYYECPCCHDVIVHQCNSDEPDETMTAPRSDGSILPVVGDDL